MVILFISCQFIALIFYFLSKVIALIFYFLSKSGAGTLSIAQSHYKYRMKFSREYQYEGSSLTQALQISPNYVHPHLYKILCYLRCNIYHLFFSRLSRYSTSWYSALTNSVDTILVQVISLLDNLHKELNNYVMRSQ
jgi:RNA processing factor Prp31